MLRVPLSKAYLHRTLRALYAFSQATPANVLLDPAWDRSTPIFPGMVAMKTAGNQVTLINGTGVPYGLFEEYIGGDGIDEPLESGINATAAWVLGPDAEFEVLAPAFDTAADYTDPGDGTVVLLHAHVSGAKRGKLAPAGTAGGTLSDLPVCRLLGVDSATKIIIGGLHVIDYAAYDQTA